MPREAKPWYREQTGTWYARVRGKRVCLGVNGEGNEKAARRAWLERLADAKAEAAQPKPTATVLDILNAYLEDAATRLRPATVYHLRQTVLPFAERYRKVKAEELTPTAAEAYSRKPTWKPGSRRTFLGRLITVFRWARRARLITADPLAGLRMPKQTSRAAGVLLSAEQVQTLLAEAHPAFRMFLEVLWATGCRPGEASAITAENFDAEAGLVRLADHKTAEKTGKPRVIFLPPQIVELLKAQRQKHPSGALLRNSIGTPWNNVSIGYAMLRLRKRTGLHHAIAYGLRHSFATDALANGVPDAQVAELLGHQGTAMLHKHYAHLGARADALRSALGKVR